MKRGTTESEDIRDVLETMRGEDATVVVSRIQGLRATLLPSDDSSITESQAAEYAQRLLWVARDVSKRGADPTKDLEAAEVCRDLYRDLKKHYRFKEPQAF